MSESRHPTEWELGHMSDEDVLAYAESEAELLHQQKQTAVPRLLRELATRLDYYRERSS